MLLRSLGSSSCLYRLMEFDDDDDDDHGKLWEVDKYMRGSNHICSCWGSGTGNAVRAGLEGTGHGLILRWLTGDQVCSSSKVAL